VGVALGTYDLAITNAKIVDGTGNPWFYGDVGIESNRISFVGRLPRDASVGRTVNALGRVLCPGFIDIHTHSDFLLLRDPLVLSDLKQGVTTQVIGQCGISPAPITSERVEALDRYVGFIKAGADPDWTWRTFRDWLDVLDTLPLGTNIAAMVGHGTVRLAVMGFENRKPDREELRNMRALVVEAMAAGAFGMTSGLIYPPGMYSSDEEIVEISAGLRDSGGIYATHMRNESSDVMRCVRETIAVAEQNGVPGEISHHKAAGRKNWGLVNETLRLLDEARDRGVDMTADQYPYTAGSTTLRAILPPWVNEGGVEETIQRLMDPHLRRRIAEEIMINEDWENLFLHSGGAEGIIPVYTPQTSEYEGKTLAQIGDMTGKAPLEAAFDIIVANRGSDNSCYIMMSEEDVQAVLRHPLVMVASDSIPSGPGGKCHPRTNGTFPRVLGRYVRDLGCLRLEEAVRKMSGLPAGRLGLRSKGLIRSGMDADLLVFDPDVVREGADFDHPHRNPVGIDYVLVNGRIAIENGKHTGVAAGEVLRKS
jgi:N-acyl-D-amino-acid deacylase